MHIPKLFCADCGTEMLPRKNGVGLLVTCKAGPYFKTSTDAWACHSCGRVVYSGHNLTRCVEHYDESFERVKTQDTVTVAEVRGHYVGQREDIPVPPERDEGFGGSFLELLYALTKVHDEAAEWSGLHHGKDLAQRVTEIAADALAQYGVLGKEGGVMLVRKDAHDALRASHAAYRKALEFYANENNYYGKYNGAGQHLPAITEDMGEIARSALSETGEGAAAQEGGA